jgi:hypothetical protein
LEGQITIVLESPSHEKTGATGACALEACVTRLTFDKSGLGADPAKTLEMPQILVRNGSTRGKCVAIFLSHREDCSDPNRAREC